MFWTCCIFCKFDERRVDFHETLTAESISNFLKLHRHRLVTEHNDRTRMKINFDNDSKRVLWLFIDENSRDLDVHIDTLADVAFVFRGQVR